MKVPAALRGNDGLLSGSRVLLFFPAGVVFGLWLAVFAGIAFAHVRWGRYEDALTWGRDFVFISLAPYVANAIAGGLARMGKGGDAAATVVNVGAEQQGGSAVADAEGSGDRQ